MNSGGTRQVMVVDEHEACRNAATDLIAQGDFELVASSTYGPPAVALAQQTRPHAILVSMDGIIDANLVAELRRSAPESGILVVSERDDAPAMLGAVRSGANGFLPRYARAEVVIEALRTVAEGGVAIDPALTGAGVMFAARTIDETADAGARFWRLTPRERETLAWLARGMTARAIATRMVVSRRTIERHLANAYRKLGTHNRRDAVREYMRLASLVGELAS